MPTGIFFGLISRISHFYLKKHKKLPLPPHKKEEETNKIMLFYCSFFLLIKEERSQDMEKHSHTDPRFESVFALHFFVVGLVDFRCFGFGLTRFFKIIS